MEDLTLIGLILVIIGVVLAPFTCFISLIVLTLIGIVLMIVGESGKSPQPGYPFPQYPHPYYPPPQYPQPQYPPQYRCSACGMPLRFIQQYNRWYCDSCRVYR